MSGRSSRPLPPLPHSRLPSGQHSIHDPAQAHSRHPSDFNLEFPEPKPAVPRLNPNAKPFVFGAPLQSPWKSDGFAGSGDHAHSRAASLGKPLNAGAQEFKPSAFTFKAAGPVFPLAEPYRPLPVPPVDQSSPFRVQGREKRRRHGSSETMEEGDSMASFKFPPTADSPAFIRCHRHVLTDLAILPLTRLQSRSRLLGFLLLRLYRRYRCRA